MPSNARLRPAARWCATAVHGANNWNWTWMWKATNTLLSLPLSHGASELALQHAARRGAMQRLGGKLGDVRAARLRIPVSDAKLDRTLVVVESQELLRGQKRGIAVALRKAKEELRKLERRAARGRMKRELLESRVRKALSREHLA